eukprot:gene9858-5900_t
MNRAYGALQLKSDWAEKFGYPQIAGGAANQQRAVAICAAHSKWGCKIDVPEALRLRHSRR